MLLTELTTRDTHRLYAPGCLETGVLVSMLPGDAEPVGGDDVTGAASGQKYTINKVRRKKVHPRPTPNDVENEILTVTDTVFQFYRDMLDDAGAPDPKPGDFWEDADGVLWQLVKDNGEESHQLYNNAINCPAVIVGTT